ncbi:MAG: hypothetical protein R3F49_21115 [Planctomycetota bacterium]
MTDTQPTTGAAEVDPAALHGQRRRLVFKLRRAGRVIEQRERTQELAYGLLVAAVALAFPASSWLGSDEVLRRLEGEPRVTYGLLLPLAQGLVHSFGAAPEQALQIIAATCYGFGFAATLALLRRLGFRRTSSIPATLVAFSAPIAWHGATSPCDFAPGIFGASALLWSLSRLGELFPRDYQWRAILLLGLGTLLRPELVLLLPAVAWAVSRHPARPQEAQVTFFSVFCVVSISVAIGLSGPDEAARLGHFIERVFAGAEPDIRGAFTWPLWTLRSFALALLGVHWLLFARRTRSGQRAPRWILPWCAAALVPMFAGRPAAGPVGSFLVPAMALGLADGLNRLGDRRAEARIGLALVTAQAVCTTWLLG